jgi:hypothetical protein
MGISQSAHRQEINVMSLLPTEPQFLVTTSTMLQWLHFLCHNKQHYQHPVLFHCYATISSATNNGFYVIFTRLINMQHNDSKTQKRYMSYFCIFILNLIINNKNAVSISCSTPFFRYQLTSLWPEKRIPHYDNVCSQTAHLLMLFLSVTTTSIETFGMPTWSVPT